MPFALLYWLHASYYGHVLTQSGTLLSCLTALEEPECVYAHHLSPLAQCSVTMHINATRPVTVLPCLWLVSDLLILFLLLLSLGSIRQHLTRLYKVIELTVC